MTGNPNIQDLTFREALILAVCAGAGSSCEDEKELAARAVKIVDAVMEAA